MNVTFYLRPDGRTREREITHVRPEDAAWFEENHIRVSMEDIGVDYAVYADCGFKVGDDPTEGPDEIIEFARGRNCADTLTALRWRCVDALNTRPTF